MFGQSPFEFLLLGMHQDKKIAELEEKKTWQQEMEFEKTIEIETETENEMESLESEIESSEVLEKRKRREAIFEMALFLVLGILIGITIKTEAVKRITIGFNDYMIKSQQASYDVSALKNQLDQKMAAQQQAAQLQESQTQAQPQ